jgi:DNA anti-recombination protein RmuC
MMYIPSEAVYYEILNSADLYDYASARRIFPVSPTTFNAYIKAILMSYEGQKIQTKAKEILLMLRAIKKEYEKTDESLNLLSRHLTNAYTQLNSVSRNFLSMGQKLTSTNVLTDSTVEVQEKLLEEE